MAVPSADGFRNTTSASATARLWEGLHGVSWLINEGLRWIDPALYNNLGVFRKATESRHPILKALNAIDPLLLEGREIYFNRQSGLHVDSHDPPGGFAALTVAGGPIVGSYLKVPRLKVRVRVHPGDIIYIRGRVLEHEIEPWVGGPRIAMPHFTHSSMWREVGLGHLVGLKDLPS
jgi:hypothetical protein